MFLWLLKTKVHNPGFGLKIQKHSLNCSLNFNKNMYGFICAASNDIPWNTSKIIYIVFSIFHRYCPMVEHLHKTHTKSDLLYTLSSTVGIPMKC